MILYAGLVVAAFVFVCLVILGATSVWMRDEHPPAWIPPEPRHVRELPPVYDQEQQLEDELAFAKIVEEFHRHDP